MCLIVVIVLLLLLVFDEELRGDRRIALGVLPEDDVELLGVGAVGVGEIHFHACAFALGGG